MINKIMKLSKIFIKDYFENLYIFNKNGKKINIKSKFTWLVLIIIVTIGYLSMKLIEQLYKSGQGILFFKIYFPILATLFMFQAIMVYCNVFFFSKDLEYILPLPIKPIELLIAKFNNVICITYGTEAILLAIPSFMYGIITVQPIMYYLSMILVLIIFPIFFIILISIIMLFIMQLTKFIKNKDIFQVLIITILSFIITFVEIYIFNLIFNEEVINIQTNNEVVENATINIEILNNKLDKLNNYFIIINPCINMINNLKIINILIELFKIIIINLIGFILFILLGKILYLKNILKNIAYINKKKNSKKIIKNKYKKNKIKKSYIKNEFKKLIKNPTFFIQGIFQYIFLIIVLLVIINLLFPLIIQSFNETNEISKIEKNDLYLQGICIVLVVIQIIFMFGNLARTAISREGKNAVVMKYIPVSLFEQFVWKNIPAILMNIIAIIGMGVVINKNLSNIYLGFYIITIFQAMLLNIISCFLMTIVDLKKPNLDWVTETSVFKDNGNKLYQYVLTIFIVLILMYFAKIFKGINIFISLSIMTITLIVVLILLIIYIKKNINKLFKKIY